LLGTEEGGDVAATLGSGDGQVAGHGATHGGGVW
jgi:hypothetical protein